MAQRARDAETLQGKFPVSSWADLSLRADNCVQTQQRQRRLRIVQRNGAVLNALDNVRRQHVSVDFQAHRCRGERIHRRLDHLVHLQHVGPERLVAKGIVTEGLLAGGHHLWIKRHSWDLTADIAADTAAVTAAIAAADTAAVTAAFNAAFTAAAAGGQRERAGDQCAHGAI